MNKAKEALKRIEYAYESFGNKMFIGHSGGKDSCVILSLTQQIYPDITIVHNVKPMLGTSGDPVLALTEQHPATLEFLYTNVCVKNKMLFMHSSRMQDFISTSNLMCQIDGARISEFDRPGKSSNIIRDGVSVSRKEMRMHEPNGIFGLDLIYPIYDWTDTDVFDYLTDNNVPFSNEYRQNGELQTYLDSKK